MCTKKKADRHVLTRSFDKSELKGKAFDALLPGSPKVISNKSGTMGPSWRELNAFVCSNGKCDLDGRQMAPQYMYDSNGRTVHVIKYRDVEGSYPSRAREASFMLMFVHSRSDYRSVALDVGPRCMWVCQPRRS